MKTNNYFTGQEGYCRRSLKENINFINIALASLGENYSQIFTLVNSDDVDKDWFNNYDDIHYSLENKLIKLNQSYIQKLQKKEEWKNDYYIREVSESYNPHRHTSKPQRGRHHPRRLYEDSNYRRRGVYPME